MGWGAGQIPINAQNMPLPLGICIVACDAVTGFWTSTTERACISNTVGISSSIIAGAYRVK